MQTTDERTANWHDVIDLKIESRERPSQLFGCDVDRKCCLAIKPLRYSLQPHRASASACRIHLPRICQLVLTYIQAAFWASTRVLFPISIPVPKLVEFLLFRQTQPVRSSVGRVVLPLTGFTPRPMAVPRSVLCSVELRQRDVSIAFGAIPHLGCLHARIIPRQDAG